MASEITVTIWTDAAVDTGVAHALAVEAAASLHRATSLATAVAASSSRAIEPAEVPAAVEAFAAVEVPEDLPVYGPDDAAVIIEQGAPKVKAPNPVYIVQVGHDFIVQTNEGPLVAHAGDFLAHDPISGHVWPVAASYVDQHYIDPPVADEAPEAPKPARKPRAKKPTA